jgi:receptor expression-enhancing protein 5/6
MDKVNHHLAEVDKYLSEIAALNALEKQIQDLSSQPQVKKSHIVVGTTAFFFLLVLVGVWADGLTTFFGFLYPAYWSIRAIQTPQKNDDTQWLTYWVVFAFFNVFENSMGEWLEGIPLFYPVKFILLVWLMYPGTRGAEVIFNNVIKAVPFFRYDSHSHVDKAASAVRAAVNSKAGNDSEDEE